MKFELLTEMEYSIFIDISRKTDYIKIISSNIRQGFDDQNIYILNDNYFYMIFSKQRNFIPNEIIEMFGNLCLFSKENEYMMMFKLNEKELRL